MGWRARVDEFSRLGAVKPGFGRILTFALGGTATLKPPAFGHKSIPVPALTARASPRQVHEGGLLFNEHCMQCHGFNAVAGSLPDLRYAEKETLLGFDEIVLRGSRASAGMPSFQKVLSPAQVQAVQAYIDSRARESAKPEESPGKH
jgi:quinohemoprotein ethanol dehydrogenase